MKDAFSELTKFRIALKEISDDFKNGKFIQKLSKETAYAIADDIQNIFDGRVKDYYDAYDPKYYDRKYRLYDMYHIKVKGSRIHWIMAPDSYYPAGYRVDKSKAGPAYIFEYMFEKGFHGGANYGPEDAYGFEFQGSNNKLEWRYPVPGEYQEKLGVAPFSLWGNFAKQTFSPSNRIEIDLQNYQNGKSNKSGTTLQKRYEEAMDYIWGQYSILDYIS